MNHVVQCTEARSSLPTLRQRGKRGISTGLWYLMEGTFDSPFFSLDLTRIDRRCYYVRGKSDFIVVSGVVLRTSIVP